MADFAIDEQFAYSDGDLNGQNGGTGWSGAWTANTLYDVASATPPSGATKYVKWSDTTTEPEATRIFTTEATTGDLYLSIRKEASGNGFSINWKDGADRAVDLSWSAATTTLFLQGTTSQNVATGLSYATWYDVHMQWVTAGSTIRARAKLSTDTTWGSWSSAVTIGLTGAPTGIDRLTLRYNQGGGTGDPDFFLARIQITDPTPATGATPTLMMMGVGS